MGTYSRYNGNILGGNIPDVNYNGNVQGLNKKETYWMGTCNISVA